MYKINGLYNILNDRPGGTAYIWKAESLWCSYTSKILVDHITPPTLQGGSSPHQGSLIRTTDGAWCFISFTWAYPAGWLPVSAPIQWGDGGFPILVTSENGGWGVSYPPPYPDFAEPEKNWTRTDTFQGTSLDPSWEWNRNPDVNSWEVNDGLTLLTTSVTDDIHSARNTLTHRPHGDYPVGTVEIYFADMADGNRAGH